MRIRRRYLFWGLVLIPLGALPLLVRAGYLEVESLRDAWRLWPLLLIGLGLAFILGRDRAGLAAVAILALIVGTLGGSVLAAGGVWVGGITDCAGGGLTNTQASDAFTGRAGVTLDLDCGSVDLSTAAGSGWQFTGKYRGTPPIVESSTSSLRIRAPRDGNAHRNEWTLLVGSDALDTIDLTVNAGSAAVSLGGADLDSFQAGLNAGDLLLDARGATITRLEASVNAGRLRITLDDQATSGTLSVNAGAIELCVPSNAALRLQVADQLTFVTNLADRNLDRSGETWTRQGSGGLIDLLIDGNAASLTLDPKGGCR